MAEDVNVVDPDSGAGYNYDSLYDWEAGEQADIDSSGTIAIAKCRCTGGTADTTAVMVSGWTTSADDYIKIWTDPTESYRHNGTYQTGNKYRLETALQDTRPFWTQEGNIWLDGIEVYNGYTGTSGDKICLQLESAGVSGYVKISNCILKSYQGANTAYSDTGIDIWNIGATNIFIWNTIFYDFNASDREKNAIWSEDADGTFYIYNCTFHNCGQGIDRDAGTITVKNCIFSSCTTDTSGTVTETYCATTNDNTKGVDSAGTGNRFSQTFTFAGASDFHLAANDAGALGYGTNLYNDANLAFQDDIDGDDRGGSGATWDIGADEYVAAGTTYQDTATDGFKGSESLARISTFLKSITDGAKASDLAANVATVQRLAADGLISTDEAIALIGLLIQHSFRFRQDDGDEDAASWLATLNANINIAAGAAFRLRYLVDSSGDPAPKQFQIEYRRKPSGGAFGAWKKIN